MKTTGEMLTMPRWGGPQGHAEICFPKVLSGLAQTPQNSQMPKANLTTSFGGDLNGTLPPNFDSDHQSLTNGRILNTGQERRGTVA
eukprot:CAMPEP_0182575518 /NCGR_PEP_ID=MMETSP1324-20130603/30486_1 /TAXON_ID=236786 /ORGANISM="Florenciella sp., Strain RCC1587" /LENGTH=85 /DNA_ID=CAMNT_0024791095 /DNA_START=22 /DNA_END=276 /DNA_ORIENTATION=-